MPATPCSCPVSSGNNSFPVPSQESKTAADASDKRQKQGTPSQHDRVDLLGVSVEQVPVEFESSDFTKQDTQLPDEVASIVARFSEARRERVTCYGAFTIFFDLVAITMVAALATCLPLAINIDDVDVPVWQAWKYWGLYNGFVVFMYCQSSQHRLQRLLFRNGPTGPELLLKTPCCDRKAWMATVLSTISGVLSFASIATLWGPDRVDRSYLMLYGAPSALGLADAFYVLLCTPRKQQSLLLHLGTQVYSAGSNAPIFMVLAGVFFGSLPPPDLRFLSAVIIFAMATLRIFVKRGISKALTLWLRVMGLDGDVVETGVLFQIDTLFMMASLILFPAGHQHYVILGSSLGLALAQHICFSNIRRALEDVQDVTTLSTTTCSSRPANEDTAMDMLFQNDPVVAPLRKESALAVKSRLNAIMDRHVSLLCLPFVYACAFTVIMRAGNKRHYYLYECLGDDDLTSIYRSAALLFLLKLAHVLADLVAVRRLRLHWLLYQLYIVRLSRTLLQKAATIAYAAIVLSSCCFVKHDGMYFLQLLSKCRDYSVGPYAD